MLGKILLDGGSVEVVLVVSGSRHDEEAVGKAGAVLDTSDNMTVNPCNKTVNPCLCVPQHKVKSWWRQGYLQMRSCQVPIGDLFLGIAPGISPLLRSGT